MDGSTTINPGSFENVTIFPRGTLRLNTGTYYLKSLDLEPQAQLLIDTTQGPVFIYVRSGLTWRGATNFTGPSDRLLVGYAGADSFAIESPFSGTLAAPDATVRLAVGATSHLGAFFAKNLQLDPDVRLTLRPFAGWDSVQFDVTPRFECLQTAPNGTKVASFGYFNPNPRAVTVPLGNDNTFSLAPTDRRQPTTFLAGGRSNNFSIGYTGTAPSWQLNGVSATIDATKTCTNSFEVASIKDATLSATSPNANFGAATSLQVSSTSQSVIAFDRKAILEARGQGRFITRARLELMLSSGAADVAAYSMRSDWQESSATFTCANDQDASSTGSRCQALDRWTMVRQAGTYTNPYEPDAVSTGSNVGGKVVIDVTTDLQGFLSGGRVSPSWSLQSRTGASSALGSREGGQAARLVLDTVPFTDIDFAGSEPFAVAVDTSLATNSELPAFADGQPRRLASLKPAGRRAVRFVEDELLLNTNSASDLTAFKARWNATEIATAQAEIPGLPKAHVLRIDTSRANEATLVANLRETINIPTGLQKVSSSASLRLLAVAAEEFARGTHVGINWLGEGAEVDAAGFNARTFTDGTGVDPAGVETSSNVYDWNHFAMHGVIDAWALMYFNDKMHPDIDVAILDAGFASRFLDPPHAQVVNCASGTCVNSFDCEDTPCPWHGTHVADAGFGEPNNLYGGAGPAGAVADLDLVYGFGDHGTTLISVPALVAAGEDIINISTAMPVPGWLSWTTIPAQDVLWATRQAGTLVFAAAGNVKTNVDAMQCYGLLLATVCPWEESVWFPCESDGVACVGATEYATKNRDYYSNYGKSVRYWASGTILTGADPEKPIGTAYQVGIGTSYASPFIAGTAALTWAADQDQGPGEVEQCLSAARQQGPDGRFVSTYNAVACAFDDPPNLAPRVQITDPIEDSKSFGSVGTISLSARADDYESGVINSIQWSSDVEGVIGTSQSNAFILYTPNGPGIRKITAKAFDPQGSSGSDTASLSFEPAPPNLQIFAPGGGAKVFLGVPQDLIGRVTNFRKIGQDPPCGTSEWTGFSGNSIIFDHLLGCSNQFTFINFGNGSVDFSMTIDGALGKTKASFKVVDDPNLHIRITSPLRSWAEGLADPVAKLGMGVPASLTAASNHDLPPTAPVKYQWSVTRVDATGAVVTLATLSGLPATYTPTGFPCGATEIKIKAMAVDALGEMDDDEIAASVFRLCGPG